MKKRSELSVIIRAKLNMLPTNSYKDKRYNTGIEKCELCKSVDNQREDVVHLFNSCSFFRKDREVLVMDLIEILKKFSSSTSRDRLYTLWIFNIKFNPITSEIQLMNRNTILGDVEYEKIAGTFGIMTFLFMKTALELEIQDISTCFRECQIRLHRYITLVWKRRNAKVHQRQD